MEPEKRDEQGIPQSEKTWLVIFTSTTEKRWWDVLFRTPEDLRHVMLMGYEAYSKQWVLYDWRHGGFDTCIVDDYDFDNMIDYLKHSQAKIIHVRTTTEIPNNIRFLSLHYCVTFAKQCLRVPNTFILTPYQLYKYLLANGGTLVANYVRVQGGVLSGVQDSDGQERARGCEGSQVC